jgi:hypothetical protein
VLNRCKNALCSCGGNWFTTMMRIQGMFSVVERLDQQAHRGLVTRVDFAHCLGRCNPNKGGIVPERVLE